MTKEQKIIVGVIAAVVIIYYIKTQGQQAISTQPQASPSNPAVPGQTDPSLPIGTPAMSQPAPQSIPASVSQPAPQSVTTDMITPVAISAPVASFAAAVTDAETQGNNAVPVNSPGPLSSAPAPFQQWAKTLGPQNYAHLVAVYPSMSSTDVNAINNIIVNNLWGTPAAAPIWNAWVQKYGFPVSGKFSNFS